MGRFFFLTFSPFAFTFYQMSLVRRTGFIYDDRFLRHDTGPSHPERAERLTAIVNRLKSTGLWDLLHHIPPRHAGEVHLAAIHTPEYIQRVKDTCAREAGYVDCPDSTVCPASYEAALLAAGAVLTACDAVMCGQVENAFCAVRPPGHHAERDKSMGFCLFNNVAVAAKYLQRQYHLKRVLILDWDVHHGNGTQHAFDTDDGTVFYASIHEHPSFCYPGTGRPEETGTGHSAGCILNLPMLPGAMDSDYRAVLSEKFFPQARAFNPQFVLISAGFDAHRADPLAHINLTSQAFGWMTEECLALAEQCAHGRLVSVLEGGYDLAALARCAEEHISLLRQDRLSELMHHKAGLA